MLLALLSIAGNTLQFHQYIIEATRHCSKITTVCYIWKYLGETALQTNPKTTKQPQSPPKKSNLSPNKRQETCIPSIPIPRVLIKPILLVWFLLNKLHKQTAGAHLRVQCSVTCFTTHSKIQAKQCQLLLKAVGLRCYYRRIALE